MQKGVATYPIYKPNRSINIRIKAGQAIKPALAKHHALYSTFFALLKSKAARSIGSELKIRAFPV